MAIVFLSDDPLQDVGELGARLQDPERGALVTFSGTVRGSTRGRRVTHLEYEAYRPLAEKQLRAIAEEAGERWGVTCAIAHRLGKVAVGERSITIAVASAHRAEAFEACRWLMDSLKTTVPIWKKEHFDGGAQWIEGSDTVPSPSSSTHNS
ncbi:molybdopterin synthase [Capsulimonas corticalis]|uniref:Molybdopterin synthase n=1 Tax=Capsulimonas corticalis TaxID=2219043 RepID=A0A402CT23_9BACT|nr:molybdenum cofactor biosynthesis protein MoaE [Capsulimonas corticalis]BDI30880.1 molybdopterin synthase [Capsulimonas corticalis]